MLLLAGPTDGPISREVMVLLRLLDSGEIEVRLIAGAGDETRGDVFGILRREATPP